MWSHRITHLKLYASCCIRTVADKVPSVGRTFLYNPLMLFHTISLGLREDKISLGLSVANYIRDNGTTKQAMPRSMSKEEVKRAR